MLQIACERLSLAPEEFHSELIEGGDLPDLVSGALWLATLRSTAETPNTMQYAGDPLESIPRDGRRQAVLAMLKENPDITHAISGGTELEPAAVIITLSIRDKATYELTIPKDRHDGLAILQMIEEQNGGQDAKA